MFFKKKEKAARVMPSTNLVPYEWIKNGVVKIRHAKEYFIVLKVKKAPNLFLKDDDEQFAFYLGLKEHFHALNPQDKMQILVVARILHVLPYLRKLYSIAENSKGKKRQIALSNIKFFTSMLENNELIGRSIYVSVNLQVPSMQKEENEEAVALEMAPKKVKEIQEFASAYGVELEQLSTSEILQYIFREFNPDITKIPEVRAPEEVVFMPVLDEETRKKEKEIRIKNTRRYGDKDAVKDIEKKANEDLEIGLDDLLEDNNEEEKDGVRVY